LEALQKKFQGDFVIPASVKKEVIEYPLKTNRFRLEAIRVSHLVHTKVLHIHKPLDANYLLHLANSIFSRKGNKIHIVDLGEMEALSLALYHHAEALVVDERTTRLLVENPLRLKDIFENKFHESIEMDQEALHQFQKEVKGLHILRSSELLAVALEEGLLNNLIDKHHTKKFLLDAILWSLRLRGCAISTQEIKDMVRLA